MDWLIERATGSAAAFHGRHPDDAAPGRRASWLAVDRRALVLGSAQRPEVADGEACARHGVEVVRRHSGGGAVLMVPGEMLWLDVVVPAGDPLWHDDVGRAMWWLGEVWAEALAACGIERAAVHRGALVHRRWSRLVCFESLGTGEVVVGDRKAVGISQRRTRGWTRLQSSIHLAWQPELLVDLLAPPRPTPGDLDAPYIAGVAAEQLQDQVEQALRRR